MKKTIIFISIIVLVIIGFFVFRKTERVTPVTNGTVSTYEIQPSYPPAKGQPSNEPLPVCDSSVDLSCLKGA